MPSYRIVYTGHFLRVFKPTGWPEEVTYEIIGDVENYQGLKDLVDSGMLQIIKQRGLVHMKESNKPHAADAETFELREFIPIHMFSHLSTTIQHLKGSPFESVEQGAKIN